MTDVLIVITIVIAVIVLSRLISAASRPREIRQIAEAELNEREPEGRD